MNSKFDPASKIWKGIEVPWPFPKDAHVSELVVNGLKKTPQRVIQISNDDDSVETCEELLIKVIRVAQSLEALAIKEDDVVSVICENSIDLQAFTNGIIQLGAIINPMSVDHSKADLVNMFSQTKPKLLICDSTVYEKTRDVLEELKSSAPIFTTKSRIEGVPFANDFFKATGREDSYQLKKFKNPSDKTMAILTSSGSTGPAKGVCMSQTFFLKTCALAPPGDCRTLSFSPIFWGSAFGSLIVSALTGECRIVTSKPFSPELFFDIVTRHKATHLLMNPPKLTLILQSPLIKTVDKTRIKTILNLGGIVTEQMRKWIQQEFPGVHFLNFYGLTEVSVTATFPGYPQEGLTVGFVQPNHQLKIVDDDGNALGIGEVGEIYAKFSITRFLGYYNNPKATREGSDSDDFIKTGDIGYVDEKGFVFVIDRKKEIFKFKGHHINPSEIENIIQAIEGVEFVAVVGIPNPETYNLIAAVIQKKKGFDSLSETDVVNHVATKLPDYKQLSGGAYFVESLPMTATSKILKREAKEIAIKLFNNRLN